MSITTLVVSFSNDGRGSVNVKLWLLITILVVSFCKDGRGSVNVKSLKYRHDGSEKYTQK